MSLASHQYIHLSKLGCIKISGTDTDKFLQGQLTIDLNHITKDSLSLGAVCNPHGRCIALFWATRVNDAILFILANSTIETTINHLTKYAVFFKTEIQNASQEYLTFGSIEAQTLAPDPQAFSDCLGHFQISDSQCYLAICRQPQSIIEDIEASKLTQSEWFYQLALAAIPWLEANSQGEFLPHNLNLPELEAVDFKKGCFTGQEVIARMQYKGKLKSHLQLFKSHQAVAALPMTKLVSDGRDVGEVICSGINQQIGTVALVILRDKYLENKIFRLNDENGPILELSTKK